MREIKFRAWSLELKKMVYPSKTGWYESVFVGKYEVPQSTQLNAVISNDLIVCMQYTGLKDKNGVDIFEGDVVKGKDWKNGKEYRFIGKVKFLAPIFKVVGINKYHGMNYELNQLCEVIGNTYENEELLGELK